MLVKFHDYSSILKTKVSASRKTHLNVIHWLVVGCYPMQSELALYALVIIMHKLRNPVLS